MDLYFPDSLGDDNHVECALASSDDIYLLFFNTVTKVKRKVIEFDGPEGWKIVPCAPNPSRCKTIVFHRDEISDDHVDELCAIYGLEIIDADTPLTQYGDMSLLIKKKQS